ncbi:putative reverse transcriptase domain-containing protein [Tanacetum coccineum]
MNKKIRTFAERQTENKRKQDDNHQQPQQQQNKRQNTGRAYAAGSGEKKPYGGSKPLCAKCNYHHDGPCAPKCHKCNRVGHLARDCRSTANANTANNQRGHLGQVRNPLAMNVEPRDTSRGIVTLSIGAFQMKSCRAPLKELSDKGIIRLSSSRLGELRSGFQEEGKWDHFECALDYRELNKLLVKDLIPPKESRFSLTSTRDPVFIYLR